MKKAREERAKVLLTWKNEESGETLSTLAARLTMVLQHGVQILPVAGFCVHRRRLKLSPSMKPRSKAISSGQAIEALALFDDLHELRRLDQRIMGAGVEPGEAAAHALDIAACRASR